MEIQTSRHPRSVAPARHARCKWEREFLISFAALAIFLPGCASPSEPTPRRPPIPVAVTDLAVEQAGNDAVLTFTLPNESIDHHPLPEPPSIEIYRNLQPPSAAGTHGVAAPANPTLVVTIPSGMASSYRKNRQVTYADPIPSAVYAPSPLMPVYIVRTRASAKADSANSNVVALHPFPAPDPINDLKAEVTRDGVNLTWTRPQKDPSGAAPAITSYRIYRTETKPATGAPPAAGAAAITQPPPPTKSRPGAEAEPAAAESTPEAESKPLAKIGDSASSEFRDVDAEFGGSYLYSVRSVVMEPSGAELESADSNLLAITPRDIFPPAAPQGLEVVFIPAQPGLPANLELSWAVSPENDVAGYNVYRSDESGTKGTRQNTELLPTPAFRDMNVLSGRHYFYTVTAVDRSGNESATSVTVSIGVPAQGQATP